MDIERVNYVLGKAIVGLQADEIEGAANYVDEMVRVPRSIEPAPVVGKPKPQTQPRKAKVGEKPSVMK